MRLVHMQQGSGTQWLKDPPIPVSCMPPGSPSAPSPQPLVTRQTPKHTPPMTKQSQLVSG